MVYKRSCLRYAHTIGYTGVVYTKDGHSMLTWGTDGEIRIWRDIFDDDPNSNCLGEIIVCIAQAQDDRLLASTDTNTLQAYTFPDMDKDGSLMRFTATVTCLRVLGDFIAAGSEDMSIKVLRKKGKEVEQNELLLAGHAGPILDLDISTKGGGMLVSAAGDGLLKIWNLETGAEIKSIESGVKTNSFENADCYVTPVFEPVNGNSLAYVNGSEICVLDTTSWQLQFVLKESGMKGSLTCCQFSSDGLLLAAGSTAGEIAIFDFMRKHTFKSQGPQIDCHAITRISWKPTGDNKELAFCEKSGQLGTLFEDYKAEVETSDDEESEQNEIDYAAMGYKFDNGGDKAGSIKDDYNDDDDNGSCVSINKLKNKTLKSAGGYNDSPLGDDNSRDSVDTLGKHSREAHTYVAKALQQQAPFQPGASPNELQHRYMVWNSVGIVTSHTSDENSIDVEFHDASVHHSLHISNYNNHTMASLSSTVLALSGGAEGSTKLSLIALAASGNKEFSVQLPDCESVEALTASNKLVAVATSSNFLRLFTVMGTQREIISLPGPVVAIAAHEDSIVVCYHSAPSSAAQQHIGALLVNTQQLQLRVQQLPTFPAITAGRQLTWLGFSECGSPIMADSMGLLQLFSLRSNCWFPVCDTMKQCQAVSQNYFIVAVLERQQIIQAVLCRGCSYPMTQPRPMLQELPMVLPLCELEYQKSMLEDELLRVNMMNVDGAEKINKETAIKLFALACRSEMEMRAKELIEIIASPELLLLAVKYATKLGRIHLSDRLYEMMPQLEAKREEEAKQMEEETYESGAITAALMQRQYIAETAAPSVKLAPKTIDLSKANRVTLKRFNNTITSQISSPLSNAGIDSQEFDNENSAYAADTPKLDNTNVSSSPRTPLNSVNPFASKRKLTDGDIIGSGKLKLAKK